MLKEKIKNTPFIGRRLVGLYSGFLRLKDRKFLKKNKELENQFASRKIFILATGPSIKTQNLKILSGQLSISVSNFFVHPDFQIIKPEYHIFAPFHPPITEDQSVKLFADAERHFPEGQKVFVSTTDRYIVEKYGLLKTSNIYYYAPGHKELDPNDKLDFTKQIPGIQTSPHIAMYLALFLGAKEIILLGCDHDWILHLKETRHFYDEKESVLTQNNYNEWEGHDLEVELRSYLSLWQKYKKIKSYAAGRSVSIYNATPSSLLDVFPRKNLTEYLAN
ncbi:MAG: hypothetical protein Q7R65_02800 [bacterium]|nr:hypothetical protein [bacterium]